MATLQFSRLMDAFSRKKLMDTPPSSGLMKCLSTFDLIVLGVGSTLGVGVYVIAGNVAREPAGPAVVISFAIAAFASMMAGLCYAEFAARVPKAGSAYVYSYVTMGELVAFLIGWTLILEYIIGAASVVRGLSTYIDGTILNNYTQNAFDSVAHINVEYLSSYPDFLAFVITMTFTFALAFGAKESSLANNFFTLINISVVLFVIIGGSFKADINNWKLKTECTPEHCPHGKGGFAPYGISGIMYGAATCLYAFTGFDGIATAGEEAKSARKSIPIAIIASLTIVFFAYFGVSTALTTVVPYYAQNSKAPIPYMFETMGWSWAKWVVTFGAICAMCASLIGAMFPLPRVIYSMASDGLIFKWLGAVNPRFHTPIWGTLSAGFITGILATIFDLKQLYHMSSIGVLLAYNIVAACVLILRYEENESFQTKKITDCGTIKYILKQLINANNLKNSTKLTSRIATVLVLIYVILCITTIAFTQHFGMEITSLEIWAVVLTAILLSLLVIVLCLINCQPISDKKLSFSVPLVPFIPALSILINAYVMMMLDYMTWIRFAVWILIGFIIYFSYGIRHSVQRLKTTTTNTNGNVQ